MAKVDSDLLLDLIGAVHDAALAPSEWPPVLERISDALDGAGVLFAVQRFPDGIPMATFARHDPAYVEILQRDHADPAVNFAGALLRSSSPILVVPAQSIGEEEYHRSELYNRVLRPQGLDGFALSMIVRNPTYMVPLCVSRRAASDGFTPSDLAFVAELLPHFRCAVQLQLRLCQLEAESGAFAEALHRLTVGVVMVAADARVLFHNRAAEVVLQAGDGLAMRGGRLVAAGPHDAKRLEALIGAAAATSERRGTNAGGSMTVERPLGRLPLSVVVSPVASKCLPESIGGAAVLVFVTDPEARLPLNGDLLASLYGLTRAEAALTGKLLDGLDIRAAAERLGIATSTARTHLAHILAKTGTRRQAELLHLILRGPAGLDFRTG